MPATRPAGSAPALQQNQTIQPEITGSWVHLPFTLDSKGNVTVIHPMTNAIMPLKEFELKVKRQGKQLYCYVINED